MRIIAGDARGRPLVAPHGLDTRPTLDRVRESLFNILQTRVAGACVLDCFAGSGALALESLSRGAAHAVLIDAGREAQQAAQHNIDTLGYGARAELLRMDFLRAVVHLAQMRARFDLFFLDPPYERTDAGDLCGMLLSQGLAAPDACFVVEHRLQTPPVPPDTLVAYDMRRYGDTAITFLTRSVDS